MTLRKANPGTIMDLPWASLSLNFPTYKSTRGHIHTNKMFQEEPIIFFNINWKSYTVEIDLHSAPLSITAPWALNNCRALNAYHVSGILLVVFISFSYTVLTVTLKGKYYLHFTHDEPEIQRCCLTSPRPHIYELRFCLESLHQELWNYGWSLTQIAIQALYFYWNQWQPSRSPERAELKGVFQLMCHLSQRKSVIEN